MTSLIHGKISVPKLKSSLSSRFGKQVERLLEKGASEAVAQAKAFNALLPVFRAKLRRLYLHYLKWFRRLKRDPVHEAVMKTLRRFMDEEEDMDYEEAADAAVDRRKFLLNRIFHPRPVPKNEEEEEEEEEGGGGEGGGGGGGGGGRRRRRQRKLTMRLCSGPS